MNDILDDGVPTHRVERAKRVGSHGERSRGVPRARRMSSGLQTLLKNLSRGLEARAYFFLYFLRAAFSQEERLEPFFLWQAFSAAASFAARSCAAVFAFGQPLTLIGVL